MTQQQRTLSDEDMETVGAGGVTAGVQDADEQDAGGPDRDDADEQDADGTDQGDTDQSDADSTDARDS